MITCDGFCDGCISFNAYNKIDKEKKDIETDKNINYEERRN